jgi:hypothetical protein
MISKVSFLAIKQHANRRIMMKKNIWLALGIAGILFGTPLADAQAKVRVHVGVGIKIGHHKAHHRRHLHKRNSRHIVARNRYHDINSRQHDNRNAKGISK